jgi:hypothetical protein
MYSCIFVFSEITDREGHSNLFSFFGILEL